ncbi:MAG: YdcF family protein [Rhizobiaceae bacterium]|nr:YdcF family protein [Rhizobiaceae bacterium]
MFFYASKILGAMLQPSFMAITILLLGFILSFTKFKKLSRAALAFSVFSLLMMSFSPLGYWLLVPLEERISKPALPYDVHGIIILGGGFDSTVSTARNISELNRSADRFIEGTILAKKFPNAKILYSGGSASILSETKAGAEIAGPMFIDLGIEKSRLILESKSRNTYENAVYSFKSVKPKPWENWLLITSAFHMPRSLGIYRKIGWKNIIPWPVDYQTRGPVDYFKFSAFPNQTIGRTDLAAREWTGLLAYWITGKTDALFPSHP